MLLAYTITMALTTFLLGILQPQDTQPWITSLWQQRASTIGLSSGPFHSCLEVATLSRWFCIFSGQDSADRLRLLDAWTVSSPAKPMPTPFLLQCFYFDNLMSTCPSLDNSTYAQQLVPHVRQPKHATPDSPVYSALSSDTKLLAILVALFATSVLLVYFTHIPNAEVSLVEVSGNVSWFDNHAEFPCRGSGCSLIVNFDVSPIKKDPPATTCQLVEDSSSDTSSLELGVDSNPSRNTLKTSTDLSSLSNNNAASLSSHGSDPKDFDDSSSVDACVGDSSEAASISDVDTCENGSQDARDYFSLYEDDVAQGNLPLHTLERSLFHRIESRPSTRSTFTPVVPDFCQAILGNPPSKPRRCNASPRAKGRKPQKVVALTIQSELAVLEDPSADISMSSVTQSDADSVHSQDPAQLDETSLAEAPLFNVPITPDTFTENWPTILPEAFIPWRPAPVNVVGWLGVPYSMVTKFHAPAKDNAIVKTSTCTAPPSSACLSGQVSGSLPVASEAGWSARSRRFTDLRPRVDARWEPMDLVDIARIKTLSETTTSRR